MSYAINATGSSMVGAERPMHDFRPTPPEPIESLLHFYRDILREKVFHDGSCGDGAIARVMTKQGYQVHATDLVERGHGENIFAPKGYGVSGVNFLKINRNCYPIGKFSTVMNPPFSHWKEFAKQQIWNAVSRVPLWRQHPPKAVHPLTWRIDFTGAGRPSMDCCWVVWGKEVPFSNQPLERVTK